MKDQRRRSIGKGVVFKIAKLRESTDTKQNSSENKATICFIDPSCALQKESVPWESAPIYQKPLKGKLTSKIDDNKVLF